MMEPKRTYYLTAKYSDAIQARSLPEAQRQFLLRLETDVYSNDGSQEDVFEIEFEFSEPIDEEGDDAE